MDDFCNILKGNYIKFIKYFYKYWRNTEIFNFTNQDNNTIKNRTNNIVERFHKKLNHDIEHYHQKCSFLVERLKKITKDAYDNYVIKLHKKDNIEKEYNYLAADIIAFIKRFVREHKVNLDIENLTQYLNQDKDNFYNLMYSIINSFGIFNENILDNIKDICKENNIKEPNDNNNIDNNTNDKNLNDKESLDDGTDNENTKTENKIIINNEILTAKEKKLINGDEILIEKINKKKKKKITSLENSNLLDELNL